MRKTIAILALALLICGSAIAADKPQVDIPFFPGGESTMEINLTKDDLLPTLQAMLQMMGGNVADKIDFNEVAVALKDVQRVQYLQLDLTKPTTVAAVADFYTKKMPAGDWNRVFWQKSSTGTTALYVQDQGAKLYGYRLADAKVDGKIIKQVTIFKTDGKIDFAKIAAIAVKFLTLQPAKG